MESIRSLKKQPVILWILLFGITMGFFESAVVIYLREIYFPGGFDFPLRPMSDRIYSTELFRELASLLMIVSVAYIAGSNALNRFGYFLFIFAVWDIFYYVFLRLFILWPESFLTWDVLFLIPVAWIGPVICPLILSVTMLVLAFLILDRDHHKKLKVPGYAWGLLTSGSVVVVLSFIWNYSVYMVNSVGFKDLMQLSDPDHISEAAFSYVPERLSWFLFVVGELIILSGIVLTGIPKIHKK
ncbi:MAG: hypothetical protein PVF73_03090 [Bacteroidales bacterium]|jgi:hypothetical protein